MGNCLKMNEKETIIGLRKLGWSVRRIHRETGHHRETIKKIVKNRAKCTTQVPTGVVHFEGVKCPPGQPPGKRSKSAPYHEIIMEQLALGVDARNIHLRLVYEHGFPGSYDSVKRYVAKQLAKPPTVVGRMVSRPGEEAQVDFGQGAPVIDPQTGRSKKPWLFKMTLGHSRHSYEEVVWQQTTETFIRCHINAFESFGGVPKIVRIDNLKAGIIKCDWYDAFENPLYQSFAEHYGFVILACRPGTPEHKGKVESGIGYTQRAVKGKKFRSLGEQNDYLRLWNRRNARTRIHGSTKRQVWRVFVTEEKPALRSLPETSFEVFQCSPRRVHRDGHIQVDSSYYSVPIRYIRKNVEVRWTDKFVRVYYGGSLIKSHLKTSRRGCYITDRSDLPDRLALAQADYPNYLKSKGAALGPQVKEWISFMIEARDAAAYRVIQGVLGLQKNYSPEIIDEACRAARENHICRYRTVKALCEERQRTPALPVYSDNHEFLREMTQYQNIITEEAR